MPPGCFTSRVCEPYFSVASTYGLGKVQGCCTPTWISTSSGIFQNRSPCHKRCSPYEKQSLYCVQFCLVMTVPGLTLQSADATAGAKIPKQIISSNPKRFEIAISPVPPVSKSYELDPQPSIPRHPVPQDAPFKHRLVIGRWSVLTR